MEEQELRETGHCPECKDDKRSVSRKWMVTVWAMAVGTAIVGFSGFCALRGNTPPEGFTGLATMLFATGIAYIGGNVWQKQIYGKEQ